MVCFQRCFFAAALLLLFLPRGLNAESSARETATPADCQLGIQGARNLVQRLEKEGPWESFGVRNPADQLFILTASKVLHPEMDVPLDLSNVLLEKIRAMQDLNPESRTYGNFRWYWRQEQVEDWNAVEFVSQRLLYCWEHRNLLPDSAQKTLEVILRDSCEGCKNHRVPTSYTNIAVHNAVNLLLLGQFFDRPDVAAEGKKRFEKFIYWTYKNGISEFSSPTYYSVAIEGLELLESLTNDAELRASARGLLDYYALEIGSQWRFRQFTGACSRTYNYRFGDDELLYPLADWGWESLTSANRSVLSKLVTIQSGYEPSETVQQVFRSALPRLVRQRWGSDSWQTKTTFLTDSWCLGTSAGPYLARQETLWALNLPNFDAEEPNPRCYFIPDSRLDPYGIHRELTGGGHNKALHLSCAWRAVQDRNRTLACVAYPQSALSKGDYNGKEIRSVFVLKTPDEWRLDAKNRLAARWGKTVLRLEIVWGVYDRIDSVVNDSPDGGCVCWTVWHGRPTEEVPSLAFAAEVQQLDDSTRGLPVFEPFSVSVSSDELRWETLGLKFQALKTLSALTRETVTEFTPAPPEDVLEVNGQALGRKLLEERIPLLTEYRRFLDERKSQPIREISAAPGASFTWKAADGLYFPLYRMEDSVQIDDETEYEFDVKTPGKYVLSATLLAPDPQHDSLRIRCITSDGEQASVEWHLGSSSDFRDVELRTLGRSEPEILRFPSGRVRLIVSPREYGVRVQQWCLKRVQ